MLEFSNVTFLYHAGRGLANASFTLEPGVPTGVMGGNGAGKSTLLGLAAGAIIAQEGEVCFKRVMPSHKERIYNAALGIGYRKHIGYMTERAPVWAELSVYRYLRFRATLRGERFLRIRHRVLDAMDQCGLLPWRKTRIESLSMGLARRVALAEAILTRPAILILDDPFAGVDNAVRESMSAVLHEFAQNSHVLISGHDPEMFANCCKEFMILDKSQLVASHLTYDQAILQLHSATEQHV